MTTFQLSVQIDGETGTFITGAENYGEAVHAVEKFLEADGKTGNILKVAPKRSITFVPPLNGKPESTPDEDLISF